MKLPSALAAVAIALALPGSGIAGDDDNEDNESVTRVACLGGTAQLRLEAETEDDYNDNDDDDGDDDEGGGDRGQIQIELRVDVRRPVAAWRLVLLHERRLLYQGVRRSSRDGHALRYWDEIPEWDGSQTVTARLATPAGRTCRLETTI